MNIGRLKRKYILIIRMVLHIIQRTRIILRESIHMITLLFTGSIMIIGYSPSLKKTLANGFVVYLKQISADIIWALKPS